MDRELGQEADRILRENDRSAMAKIGILQAVGDEEEEDEEESTIDEGYANPWANCFGIFLTMYAQNVMNSVWRRTYTRVQDERKGKFSNQYTHDYEMLSPAQVAYFLRAADPTNRRERPCCYAMQTDENDTQYKDDPKRNHCMAWHDHGVTLREYISELDNGNGNESLPEERQPCIYCWDFSVNYFFWTAKADDETPINFRIQPFAYMAGMPGGYRYEYILPQVRQCFGFQAPYKIHDR